jgi:hypothetical protein
VVKFSGYQLDKVHTLRIKLINISSHPQRLYILPPMTAFFKIKYNKKGVIPSGVSEEVFISFTPDTYKYYQDCI